MTNLQAMSLRRGLEDRGVGRGRRYPKGMRDRAIAFAVSRREEGRSWSSIATELGMHFETLRCWCIKAGSKPARMRAVRVVDSVAGRTVAVVSPNGYRVPEVSIEEAVAILRAVG
jgi:hypothetical protein